MRRSTLASAALLASALLVALAARPAGAAPGRRIESVFFVAKSENRNEVHYGIVLDRDCVPAGPSPVFAYWRMREHGPLATEPLLSREVAAYGIAEPQRTDRAERGGRVVFRLNAMPNRMIAIDTAPDGDGCRAAARVMIGGTPAALISVFVQLRWPFGVDYLLLSGRAATDGRVVRERLER